MEKFEWFSVHKKIKVIATDEDGKVTQFDATVRLDTPVEVEYYRNGGILHNVLRNFLAE